MAYGSTVLHIANASLSAFWILLIVKYPFKILSVLTPVVCNHGGLLFMRGLYPFPPPVFTGFKFSLIKTL